MKAMKCQLLCLLLMVLSSVISVSSQSGPQTRKIRHVEHYQTGTPNFRNEKLPAKTKRKSSEKGNIVLIYDESLPDSVKIAFELAKDIWEAKLPNKIPINIKFAFQPLGDGISMITEAVYTETEESVVLPTSLINNIAGNETGIENGPDGFVYFNSEMDWECSFTVKETPSYNLTTMAMRGIARCLGFGSTLAEFGENSFDYYCFYPSLFDKMLYSPNAKLTDWEIGSEELADFVQSNQIFLDTPSRTYRIYAPEKFEQDRSLCCLTDDGSLMSANLGAGSTFLSIDESTIDILRTIGWDFPITSSQIICDDISSNGIGSAYISHTFSLAAGTTNAADHKWKFYLKQNDGRDSLISTATTANFKVEKISSINDFSVNIDGDLQGRIECEYSQNGKRYAAIPFHLSLELKPSILSIDNLLINRSDFSFSLKFDVNYVGAEQIDVEVEEEYGAAVRLYSFYEPFYAHAMTGNINSLYYSWVTVTAENNYGTAYRTIDFPPVYNESAITTSVDGIDATKHPVKVQLIRMDGSMIFDGAYTSVYMNYCPQGIYIKRVFFKDGSQKTTKITIR